MPAKLVHVSIEADNPFAGVRAYFLSRVSSVDGVSMLLEEMFLSPVLFPGIDDMDLSGKSISHIVEEVYYMKPISGRQTFKVTALGPERALHLDISENSKVLKVKRFLHFPQAKNGIYAELFCFTDRFDFSQTLELFPKS
jgi:GntR family transcriptional regulator